jgi:hypothetical protein
MFTGIPFSLFFSKKKMQGEIAEDMAHYLTESEQTPSALGFFFNFFPFFSIFLANTSHKTRRRPLFSPPLLSPFSFLIVVFFVFFSSSFARVLDSWQDLLDKAKKMKRVKTNLKSQARSDREAQNKKRLRRGHLKRC